MRALPLADELFLIGHDEYSGKCLANAAVLGRGLAGAILDVSVATLAALVRATELEHVLLLTGGRHQLRELLLGITEALPADLRAIITAVNAAVAGLALAVRR